MQILINHKGHKPVDQFGFQGQLYQSKNYVFFQIIFGQLNDHVSRFLIYINTEGHGDFIF